MDQVVSIVGNAYFQPIANLLEDLLTEPRAQAADGDAGAAENGFSAALCTLAVASLDSFTSRIRAFNRDNPVAKRRNALEFISGLYPDMPELEALTEVLAVRDLLMHPHLAESDLHYKGCVDDVTKLTRKLGLHTEPTRLSRADVAKVLKTVWKTLLFFEGKNRNQCYVSPVDVRFRGKLQEFGVVVAQIERECL